MSIRTHTDIVVLGAGIQGVCSALALANRGRKVTLIDAAEDCMLRASGRNEGKIHLGFVYANDRSGRTSELMLDAALQFGELIERWCGRPLPWPALRSRPFAYLVLEDSMLPPSAIIDQYASLECRVTARDGARYLGTDLVRLFDDAEVTGLDPMVNRERVAAVISTAEVALDIHAFRAELRRDLLANPLIETCYSHTVRDAARTDAGFSLSGLRGDATAWEMQATVVVNCLWDQRIALDRQLDIIPSRPWVHRLKYRVLGHLPDALAGLPSLTLVLGRFGDIVVHPGAAAYLSWYPACLAGWESTLAPPASWGRACTGDDRRPWAREIARNAVAGFAEIVPAVSDFRIESVGAGIITAWGSTDIDDPASDLHERSDIGVSAHDGWYSIDTGKFTTAPLFAAQLADAVVG